MMTKKAGIAALRIKRQREAVERSKAFLRRLYTEGVFWDTPYSKKYLIDLHEEIYEMNKRQFEKLFKEQDRLAVDLTKQK